MNSQRILAEQRTAERRVLEEGRVVGTIAQVDPADKITALGWFYENRPRLEVLDVFFHHGVIHATACILHPGIGDPPDTEIWRRKDDLTFENVAWVNPDGTQTWFK